MKGESTCTSTEPKLGYAYMIVVWATNEKASQVGDTKLQLYLIRTGVTVFIPANAPFLNVNKCVPFV